LQDQPVGRDGGPAGVEAVDLVLADGVEGAADLAFDEAEDEQGEADHGDQGGDPAVVLEVDRGDGEGSFERGVAAFDGCLTFVVQQHRRRLIKGLYSLREHDPPDHWEQLCRCPYGVGSAGSSSRHAGTGPTPAR
jgi:hypothetical protein